MALDPLASTTDVALRLGRELTDAEGDRMEAILADASASVRAYTGQQFTEATTTDTFRVRRNVVVLPQRPVTAVSDAGGVYYRWDGLDRVHFSMGSADSFEWEPWIGGGPRTVTITYSHGYDEIPADIVGVVCSIALRAWGRKPEDGGLQQESIAGYSYSVGSAGAAGGFGMLPDERAVLDRYRRVAGWVDVT